MTIYNNRCDGCGGKFGQGKIKFLDKYYHNENCMNKRIFREQMKDARADLERERKGRIRNDNC